MKRQLWVLLAGLALALGGCAVESGAPGDGTTDEQSAELGVENGAEGAALGGTSTDAVGRPGEMVTTSSGDPSGPTPYPWESSDDPSGGPTPYPWGDDADQTDNTNDGTGSGTSNSGATQKTTSTNH